jgi:hypothetical protein
MATVTHFSLAGKMANHDDPVCSPSVAARDHPPCPSELCSIHSSFRGVGDALAERGPDIFSGGSDAGFLKFRARHVPANSAANAVGQPAAANPITRRAKKRRARLAFAHEHGLHNDSLTKKRPPESGPSLGRKRPRGHTTTDRRAPRIWCDAPSAMGKAPTQLQSASVCFSCIKVPFSLFHPKTSALGIVTPMDSTFQFSSKDSERPRSRVLVRKSRLRSSGTWCGSIFDWRARFP